ncbi:bestrophin family protein [Pleurocapsa sp. PCC 7319]|uniref:bestrophin family protein n=1 Tax=Pleurocapsa sp. PCC 7319 TaxID=118161 RepID=UPI00036F8F5F|nr:bestrophin family ion channel [Pleurocapsa sp. PCC 7319]
MDKKLNWLEVAFQLEGSVVKTILPRIFIFTSCASVICLSQYMIKQPEFISHVGDLTNNVVYNLVLGLLLVFRTNTAYERFWEGRKSLGLLVVNVRNLARFIHLSIIEEDPKDGEQKTAVLNLLGAFAVATKLQLRGEPANNELKALLSAKQSREIDSAKRMTLQVALWIGEYLQQQLKLGKIDSSQRVEMNNLLNNMVEGLSSCERISQTALPIAYRIYLKRLILIYCLCLPFNLIEKMGWWTLPVVAIVSFILLGLEEVGNELENPFLYGVNDLPVDNLCNSIISDVESIANFSSEEFSSLRTKDCVSL